MTRMREFGFTLQEWLGHSCIPTHKNKPLRYAMWWVSRYLEPSRDRVRYLDFDGGHLLYVTYRGRRYQVLAVNLLSQITLRGVGADANSEYTNLQMSNEADFSDWSNTIEGPLDDSKFVPHRSGQ